MATRAVQAIVEENPFAIDLFNFLWDVLNHAKGKIPNPVQSYFNQDIGFAVLYMQFVTRHSVRDVLKGIHIRTTEDALHVTRKLCRARRKKQPGLVLQVFLESCAIIAEVYLYCYCGIQLPVEGCMVFLSWNMVFNRRRMREFLSSGGWDELTAYAFYKYHKKINFIHYQIESLEYPYENFITDQVYDDETDAMVTDFQDSFDSLTKNREFQVDQREQYRQMKATMRMRRIEDRLTATKRMGTADAESILASQSRIAMRSGRKLPTEPIEWANDISPYVTSAEDSDEDPSPSVSELCTKMSDAQIAERKKKKPKRKKKRSQKSTEGEPTLPDSLLESESPEKETASETFASSSRPLKVPASPATSPTKTASPTKASTSVEIPATKGIPEASPGPSKTGKKGRKKK